MPLNSLIVFGSYARGDSVKDSDVDILGIVKEGSYDVAHLPGFSLVVYSYQYMLDQARKGNLFIWHLKEEGKPLYDSEGLFKNVTNEFQFKESYQDRIDDATYVGKLLLENRTFSLNQKIACKYLLFVIRTIAIAIFASKRIPCFSKQDMIKNFQDSNFAMLWEYKYRSSLDEQGIEVLKQFLFDYGNKEVLQAAIHHENLNGYAQKVYNTLNKIVHANPNELYKG